MAATIRVSRTGHDAVRSFVHGVAESMPEQRHVFDARELGRGALPLLHRLGVVGSRRADRRLDRGDAFPALGPQRLTRIPGSDEERA